MPELLQTISRQIKSSASSVSFETTGTKAWPVWDRYLTIEGKRAYNIGNICGTCAFLFERLEGANVTVNVGDLTRELADGVKTLDGVVDPLSLLLPVSDYRVALLRFIPRIVKLGGGGDYFAAEQVENYNGVDPFWGLPHHPKVPYYRPASRETIDLGATTGKLFNFIIPMFPESWLDAARTQDYVARMKEGIEPTAVAVSILDVKAPATSGEAHWCMAHYLLDGHHKLAAAARSAKPMTLIAFVAVDRGISNAEQVARALQGL
ncbi:hypothetical protein [Ferrovibrio terrae]|uniref:hypothetical protein n=1 Tax=Ferrovibrio terrae TaxID=2594003 RepID=UPI003137D378